MAQAIAAVPYAEGNLWRASAADGTELTIARTMHLFDPRQQAQIDPFVVKSQVVVYRL